MKIGVVCPRAVPYVRGGAERLWDGLVRMIPLLSGHEAELIAIDSPEANLSEVLRSYVRFDRLDVSEFDIVITSKYPAWMVRHPRHVVYMMHPLRGLYDTYGGSLSVDPSRLSSDGFQLNSLLGRLQPGELGARDLVLDAAMKLVDNDAPHEYELEFPGPLARRVVRWLDRDAFHPRNTRAMLAISATVARRPGYFPAEQSVTVVHPPSALQGLAAADVGRNFFTASRLDGPKRVGLVAAAMDRIDDPDIQLRIAGRGPEHERLSSMAIQDPRIVLLGQISDDDLVVEYQSALAVPFVPQDEDLGLITLEAQLCGKAVITCSDSGGVTEFVEHGVNGLIVSPTVDAIGDAMSRLANDPQLAAEMGRRAESRAQSVTWKAVVDSLLSAATQVSSRRRRRLRVVALSTYPATPARHGGQVRIHRLLSGLSRYADVHVVALGPIETEDVVIGEGFTQSTAVQGDECRALDLRLHSAMGVPTGDVAAGLVSDIGPFAKVAQLAVESADAVILCQPYLYRYARSSPCLIYDSHNVEHELKRSMYPQCATSNAVVDAVAQLEAATIARSSLVTAVSESDLRSLRSMQPTLASFVYVPNGGDVLNRPFVGRSERAARREHLLRWVAGNCTSSPQSIAVFVGSAHPPNIAAAQQILAVAERMPEVLFLLAGTHVQALGGYTTAPNVVAQGLVEPHELDFILSAADVALNPVQLGSGTNIKMLDYFALGAPTISTQVGARGLGAEHGRHYWQAEYEDFEMSLRTVLADPEGAHERATHARRLAERLDWQIIAEEFAGAVLRVLDDRDEE